MSNKKKEETEQGVSQRIGRALVKFFKPIKTTAAHDHSFKPDEYKSGTPAQDAVPASGSGLTGQLPEDKYRKKKPGSIRNEVTTVEEEIPVPDRQANQNWLNLVIYLLELCRRTSTNMKVKFGLRAYRTSMNSRGQERIKTLGTIVDTVTTIKLKDDEEAETTASADQPQAASETKRAA